MPGTSTTMTVASITETAVNASGSVTGTVSTTTLFAIPTVSTQITRVTGVISFSNNFIGGTLSGTIFAGGVTTLGSFTSGLGYKLVYSGGSPTSGFYLGSNVLPSTATFPGVTVDTNGTIITVIFNNFLLPSNCGFQISDNRNNSGGTGTPIVSYNLTFTSTNTQ